MANSLAYSNIADATTFATGATIVVGTITIYNNYQNGYGPFCEYSLDGLDITLDQILMKSEAGSWSGIYATAGWNIDSGLDNYSLPEGRFDVILEVMGITSSENLILHGSAGGQAPNPTSGYGGLSAGQYEFTPRSFSGPYNWARNFIAGYTIGDWIPNDMVSPHTGDYIKVSLVEVTWVPDDTGISPTVIYVRP